MADSQACLPCPSRTAPDPQQVTCQCSSGFYSPINNEDCNPSPQGGVCLGANQLLPAQGYWRSNSSSWQFYGCPYPPGCNGSDSCGRATRVGPLSAVCATGYTLVAGQCLRCTSGASVVFWVVAVDVGFLHNAYKDEYYWWDLTQQLRKLVLLLCNAVLAPCTPTYYGPCSLSISLIALCTHLKVEPYKTNRDMWFQTADLVGVTLYFIWTVTPPQDNTADTLAWIYWLYAICYTMASLE